MAILAINGGSPARTKPFHGWPVSDQSEVEAVTQVVQSGRWWHSHQGSALGIDSPEARESKVAQFQRAFAAYHGAKHGIACANGTAALEVALKALGVKPGDEVICPPYTFIATSNAILQVGGAPVFADVDPQTYNIDPKQIEKAVTRRTVGLIPVHFGGQPADMGPILRIARKHGLFVLEDAAHAHGAMWRNKHCGAIGEAGAFSFQASKNMTAGEGGMILTNNRRLAERMESLVWCGRKLGGGWYRFYELGWNYRMSEFLGAILLCQLKRLREQTATRDANAQYLAARLAQIPGIAPVKRLKDTTIDSRHIFMIRYDAKTVGVARSVFVQALKAEGIRVSEGYSYPLFDNPLYRKRNFWNSAFPVDGKDGRPRIDYRTFRKTCPVAVRACESEAIWISQSVFLGPREDMDDIHAAFQKVAENVGELKGRAEKAERGIKARKE